MYNDYQERIINANIDKNFDLNKFNKEFVFKKKDAKIENDIPENKLKLLYKNVKPNKKEYLYNLSVLELANGIKNTWFNILDDLLNKKFEMKTLTKNNRLFFIGLTIVIIIIMLYIYDALTTAEKI